MTTNFDAALAFGANVNPGIFSGDHGEAAYGDGLSDAAPSDVTTKFCRADRTMPLSPQEGRELWQKLRGNRYNACSIKIGSKAPFGVGWQKRAFEDASEWRPEAPGIGLVCGGLDPSGEPVPVSDGLIVLDYDFRLTKKVAEYTRAATEAVANNRPGAARLTKVAEHLQAIEPELKMLEDNLSRILGSSGPSHRAEGVNPGAWPLQQRQLRPAPP